MECNFRDEPERAIAFEADDREVPAIESENGTDILPLGEVDQRGIGELNGAILVATHDRGDMREAVALQWQEIKHPGGVSLGDAVDGPVLLAEEPGGFGEHGPAGE